MGGEVILILLAVLVLFGADKLPGLARTLGKGMYEVKKATDEIKNELMQSTGQIRNELNQATSAIRENLNEIHQSANEPIKEINSSAQIVDKQEISTTEVVSDTSSEIYKTTESGFNSVFSKTKKEVSENKPEDNNQTKA